MFQEFTKTAIIITIHMCVKSEHAKYTSKSYFAHFWTNAHQFKIIEQKITNKLSEADGGKNKMD